MEFATREKKELGMKKMKLRFLASSVILPRKHPRGVISGKLVIIKNKKGGLDYANT